MNPPPPEPNQNQPPYGLPTSDESGSDDDQPNQETKSSSNHSHSSSSPTSFSPSISTTTTPISSSASTNSLTEREVYSFGQNSYGELGHGHTEERRVPVRIEFCRGKNIVCIAAGNEHTCLLSDTGVVYAAGYNDSGQCGTGNSGRVPSLQAVESFRGHGVVKLISSNGCEHTSAVTEDGELWTCGYNARGQLGHGNKTHQSVPRLIESLRAYRVKHVSCSYYHSIVACEDGKIFGFGRNDYGQLGLGHNEDKLRPTPITFFNGQRIIDIACGQYHSLVSVGSGGIFAFGKNDYGQLGIVPNEPKWHPVMVTGSEALQSGEIIPRIACGYYHSLALKKDGTVFSFGRNDYGQLGLGNNEGSRVPKQIDALSTLAIREVTSGCYHSIALTRTGSVYVWGRNNHGQLGIGTTDDCNTPSRIDALIHKTALQVTAGFYHTLILTGSPDDEVGSLSLSGVNNFNTNNNNNYNGMYKQEEEKEEEFVVIGTSCVIFIFLILFF